MRVEAERWRTGMKIACVEFKGTSKELEIQSGYLKLKGEGRLESMGVKGLRITHFILVMGRNIGKPAG